MIYSPFPKKNYSCIYRGIICGSLLGVDEHEEGEGKEDDGDDRLAGERHV